MTWLEVSSEGRIDPNQLQTAVRPDTTLVSVMSANNETGVIQPLKEISGVCRQHGVLLHSDMVEPFGKLPTECGSVDAASFAGHKFYGPKRSGHSLSPFGVVHRSHSIWWCT